MANFMKRNGKWQARVSWRDANGKLHQKSKAGFATKAQAKRMKMDSSYISKIESGNRKVSSAELDSFANIFDVSADYLLGRDKTDAKDPQNDLSRNQKLVAYSIDPDISDEERQAIIEMVQAAKKFRRRI